MLKGIFSTSLLFQCTLPTNFLGNPEPKQVFSSVHSFLYLDQYCARLTPSCNKEKCDLGSPQRPGADLSCCFSSLRTCIPSCAPPTCGFLLLCLGRHRHLAKRKLNHRWDALYLRHEDPGDGTACREILSGVTLRVNICVRGSLSSFQTPFLSVL